MMSGDYRHYHNQTQLSPYREPPPPSPPPTLIQRLKNARGAKPILGFFTIVFVVATVLTALTVPGIGLLFLLKKTDHTVTNEDVKMAPIFSCMAIFFCLIAYKIFSVFYELVTDVGRAVFEWAERREKKE